MDPWWERFPGLLEHELEELRKAGIKFVRDRSAFEVGIVAINATCTVNEAEIKVRAVYPDLFPYFRFEVYAPDLNLKIPLIIGEYRCSKGQKNA